LAQRVEALRCQNTSRCFGDDRSDFAFHLAVYLAGHRRSNEVAGDRGQAEAINLGGNSLSDDVGCAQGFVGLFVDVGQ